MSDSDRVEIASDDNKSGRNVNDMSINQRSYDGTGTGKSNLRSMGG